MDSKFAEIIQKAKQFEESLPPRQVLHKSKIPLVSYLDYANHNPETTPSTIAQMCKEAVEYQFATVFTNPIFIPQVKRSLDGSGVNVGSIAGFPLGAYPTRIKVEEARNYIEMGADEIDMVMAVGMLKAGEIQFVFDDISQVASTVHKQGKLIKVILETALLTKYEKILACLICKEAGADFVKTSTGFSKGGATVEDIDLMRRVVGPTEEMGVKAAGGIHNLNEAVAMIEAGANRIGAGAAVKIIEEYQQKRKAR